jgi:prophage regulatory protein
MTSMVMTNRVGGFELSTKSIRRWVRMPELLRIVPYTERTIFRKMAAGTFPRAVRIDPDGRAVAWFEDEIIAYQKAAVSAAAERVRSSDDRRSQ